MSDFIYPECPDCSEVPSEGEGVGLEELPMFQWMCPECLRVHIGYFPVDYDDVQWLSSRKMSSFSRCVARSKLAAQRYLKHITG